MELELQSITASRYLQQPFQTEREYHQRDNGKHQQ